MRREPEETEIVLSDITIRGLRSAGHTGQANSVLCIHGWLDNANSFLPMLPLLPHLDCVAIDLPGHGKSDHFRHSVPYTIATAAHYVFRVADALNWDNFHIIGHSLGGCIAPICALIDPDRISSLVLIDALGPIAEPANALPARLKRFHHDMKARNLTSPRVFDNVEQAISSRLKATRMNRESARLIVTRQLYESDGHLKWRFDAKLRAASPTYFSEEQVQHILKAVQCPTLCVIAREGHLVNSSYLEQREACVESLTRVDLPGNHHLHMDNPLPLTQRVSEFLSAAN